VRLGVCCAGLGEASTGDFIARSAKAAERAGFSAYWVPDHLVTFAEYPESTYPYADYFVALPDPRMGIADPITAMTWAAAVTTRIEVGCNVVVLPQRNPVVLAKQLSTLDEFSGGRVAFGAGSGWAKEEYAAASADWPNRGKRMDEYIAVMRALWREDLASHHGETFDFTDAYMFPKPVRGDIPILLGGESAPAMRRVARAGDGWFAFRLLPDSAHAPIAELKRLTRECGRDPEQLRIFAPLFPHSTREDLEKYREAGVTDGYVVLTGQLPVDDAAMNDMMAAMSERFGAAAR